MPKLIKSDSYYHSGYGAGDGDVEMIEYECPCGNGVIREEHDNIPGFRDHDVYIDCDTCSKLFDLNTKNGTRIWKIDTPFIKGFTKSKIRLDESIKNRNLIDCIITFFEFLTWGFSILDKCNKEPQEVTYGESFNDVYNIFKHTNYEMTKCSFLLNISNNSVIFSDISQISDVREVRINRFNDILKGKEIKNLSDKFFKEVVNIYYQSDEVSKTY